MRDDYKSKQISQEENHVNEYDKINWENYNYPKFLKLVHFDLDEIRIENMRKIVIQVRVVFILIAVTLCVNSIIK